MKRLRPAETAFTILRDASHSSDGSLANTYICRACRNHAVRSLHNSSSLRAVQDQQSPSKARSSESSESYLKRLRDSLFPSKESVDATQKREEAQKKAQKKALKKVAQSQTTYGEGLEKLEKDGRVYRVAHVVDRDVHSGYAPAKNWKDLQRIGSEEYVKLRADRGEVYQAFAPKKPVQLTDAQWENLLHSIVVEVLALKAAGRTLNQICIAPGDATRWARTQSVEIVPGDDNGSEPTLAGETPAIREEVLAAIPSEPPEQGFKETGSFQQILTSQVLENTTRELSSWSDIAISDPAIKLAIIKRIFQLTSHRLPDPTLTTIKTLADLRTAILRPSPIRRLRDAPQLQPEAVVAVAPNVSISPRRRGMITKEKEVGRWKVIVDELRRRQLPVKGTNFGGMKVVIPPLIVPKEKKGKGKQLAQVGKLLRETEELRCSRP